MDNRSVVEAFFACWSVQDVERAVEFVDPDIVYTIHIAPEASPFAGAYRGREACRTLAYAILKDFDYLKYEPTIVAVDGAAVRARVAFKYRHRPTGTTMEGTRRLLFEVRDGLICRLDGFDDARRFEAFMRLVRNRLAAGDLVAEPELPARTRQDAYRRGR